MAKEPKVHQRHHNWVLIQHKRGYARCCVNCGKIVYYGRHKVYCHLAKQQEGVLMSLPVYDLRALALPHGVQTH